MASISHTVGGTENLVSFKSAARVPITSLKAHFKPIQEGEGTPSPDNVRPIRGWDGVEVYKTGKNLFNRLTIEDGYIYQDGSVVLDSGASKHSALIPVSAGNTYVFSGYKTKSNYVANKRVHGYNENGVWVKQINYYSIPAYTPSTSYNVVFTIAPNDNIKYVKLSFENKDSNIQLELGSTVTSYEPYHSETIPVTFPVLGKNKFNPEMEWTIGQYRYAYLPELEQPCNISFILKDATIDVSDISVGFSYYAPSTVSEINKGYIWCLGQGVIKTYAKINTANNGENTGKICTYLTIYPKTQEVYNRLISAYDIQIEYGNTATAYEPYNPDNTVYGGYVDLAKGELVQEWKIIDLGTLNWSYAITYSSSYPNWPHFYNSDLKDKKNGWNNGITSIYPLVNSMYDRTKDLAFTCTGYHSSYNICIRDTRYTTLEDFKMAIKGIQYCYELQEPIHYPLSSQELTTFLNQNNTWTSTNDVTELSYAIHDTAPIRAARKRIQAAAPGLKTQEGELVNFETDVPAPLKECKAYFKPKQDFNGYDRPWPAGGGKNLLPYPYVETTKTENDITFTDIGDGQIKISGTNSSSSYVYFTIRNDLDFGETYNSFSASSPSFVNGDYTIKFIGMVSGIGAEYFGSGLLRFRITAGATINATVGPVLYKTSDNLASYEPYENICPIEGWESFNIIKSGKNLCGGNTLRDKILESIPSASDNAESRYVSFSYNASTVKPIFDINYFPIKPLTQYTFIMTISNDTYERSNLRINYTNSYKLIPNPTPMGEKVTLIATNPPNTTLIEFLKSSNGGTTKIYYDESGIFEGELSANDFILYNGTTIPITFPTEAGTIYGGYVDLVRGEVVQEWVLYRLPVLTNTNINIASNSYIKTDACDFYVVRSGDNAPTPLTSPLLQPYDSVCNRLSYARVGIWSRVGYPNTFTVNNNQIHINLSNDLLGIMDYTQETATTVKEKIIQYMNNMYNNGDYFEFCYKISPIHYTIDPQTFKTFRGTNNIWSNSNGDITVQFWRH